MFGEPSAFVGPAALGNRVLPATAEIRGPAIGPTGAAPAASSPHRARRGRRRCRFEQSRRDTDPIGRLRRRGRAPRGLPDKAFSLLWGRRLPGETSTFFRSSFLTDTGVYP